MTMIGRVAVQLDAEHLRDGGVTEGGEDLRFALEAAAAVGVTDGGGRQDLQGDVAFESRVARAEHFAHAAGAERRDHFVRARRAHRERAARA